MQAFRIAPAERHSNPRNNFTNIVLSDRLGRIRLPDGPSQDAKQAVYHAGARRFAPRNGAPRNPLRPNGLAGRHDWTGNIYKKAPRRQAGRRRGLPPALLDGAQLCLEHLHAPHGEARPARLLDGARI